MHGEIGSCLDALSVLDIGNGEVIQARRLFGIIAVTEVTCQHVEGHYLAQFEVLNARNAVEDPAFEVVGHVQRGISVHEKLHRLHEREGLRVHEDRLVADRHEELGIGCFLSCQIADIADDIQVTESRQPEAFLGGELDAVVEETVLHDITHFIRETEDRRIFPQVKRRLDTLTVVVDISTRRIAQRESPHEVVIERRLGVGAVLVAFHIPQQQGLFAFARFAKTRCSPLAGIGIQVIPTGRAVGRVVHEVKPRDDGELIGIFLLVFQPQLHDVLHRLGVEIELDGHEDMVTVQDAVSLRQFLDVVTKREGQVMSQALVGMIRLVVERMQQREAAFRCLIRQAVRHVAAEEPPRMGIGRSHTAYTETTALLLVVGEGVEDRSEVPLGRVADLTRRDKLLNQVLNGVHQRAELRHTHQLGLETIDQGLFARQLYRAQGIPIGCRTFICTGKCDGVTRHVEEAVRDRCAELVLFEMSRLTGIDIML